METESESQKNLLTFVKLQSISFEPYKSQNRQNILCAEQLHKYK